jgi:hypothetical protein
MRPRTAKRPPQVLIDKAVSRGLPTDRWITYQFKHVKCGKPFCHTCRTSKGHGPYWRAYFKGDDLNLKSFHVGREATPV